MNTESLNDTMLRLKKVFVIEVLFLVTIAIYLVYKSSSDEIITDIKLMSNNTVDHEFWTSLGLESSTQQFIHINKGDTVLDDIQSYRSNILISRELKMDEIKVGSLSFNINKSDVMVVMHIQKTGGTTFETFLAHHTNIRPPCHCNVVMYNYKRDVCSCLNNKGQDWMVNRHSTGWVCGVHADFTDLTECVDKWFNSQENERRKRSYHYVTMLRDPVSRFISEWLHVRRGATWKESRLHCDGKDASLQEIPFCFQQGTWTGVTFDDFMKCSSNMAFNRQTRMLANLSLSDCYRLNSTKTQGERDEIMLESAKENLKKFFTFFGLLEYIEESQVLFEKTFRGLKFTRKMSCKKYSAATNYAILSEKHWNSVVEKNLLDVKLYQFARDLFFQRLSKFNVKLEPRKYEVQILRGGATFSVVTNG